MARFARLNDPDPRVRARLQAALYYAREDRKERAKWWARGATLQLDFDANRHVLNESKVDFSDLASSYGFSRANPAVTLKQNMLTGEWESFSAGEPRVSSDGFLTEPASTNLSANFNAKPTSTSGVTKGGDAASTLTVVSDEAELRVAGFGTLIDEGVMNGNVFKLDNSAGTTFAFAFVNSGAVNTNVHSCSVFARNSSNVDASMSGTGAWGTVVTIPKNTGYARYSFSSAPPNTGPSNRLQLGCDAGAVLYFILNQIEELSSPSSPIITAGTSVSRSGPEKIELNSSVPKLSGNQGTLIWRGQIKKTDTFFNIISLNNGSTNSDYIEFYYRGGGNSFRVELKSPTSQHLHTLSGDNENIFVTVGITWKNGVALSMISGATQLKSTGLTFPTGLTKFTIGGAVPSLTARSVLHGDVVALPKGLSDEEFFELFSKIDASGTIFFWGDSLTAGSGASSTSGRYPNQLSTLFSVDKMFYNGGVGGNTSTQIKDRMIVETGSHHLPTIIWAGRNNYSSPATVLSDIETMVGKLKTDKFLVLSVINGEYSTEYQGNSGYNTMMSLNEDLSEEYGDHYVDVRSALVAAYNPGVPQDVTDHGRDIVPSSLRSDNIHLVNAGYSIVANTVFSALTNNGYMGA